MEYGIAIVILVTILWGYHRIKYLKSGYQKFEYYLNAEAETLGWIVFVFEFILQIGGAIGLIYLVAQFIKLFI